MVGSKRGHSKSLALKTKDLYHRHFGDLKMDKVELRKEATIFVVPVHKNKVKAVYVKRVIEIIEEYGKS